jgi:F0F1-type ATP synthase assembly protein I
MDREKPGRGRKKVPVPTTEEEAEQLRQTRLKLIGLSFQFGFTIVGAFILFMGGGILLDRWLDTSPIFLLIGMVVAFIAIGYSLYEIATIGYKPRAKSVANGARQPATTPAPKRGYDDEPEPQDDWDRDDWKRDDWKRDDDWPVRRAGDKSGGS